MIASDEAAPTGATTPVSTKRALGRNMAFNTAGLGVETAVGVRGHAVPDHRLGESTYGSGSSSVR